MAKNIQEIKQALASYGITDVEEVIYNPSYEELYKDEMNPSLTGFEKGIETELGAVNVMTGIYTGRSPKDKHFVMDEVTTADLLVLSDIRILRFFHKGALIILTKYLLSSSSSTCLIW